MSYRFWGLLDSCLAAADFRIAGIQVIVVYVKIIKVMLISKNELSLYG